MSFQRPTLVKSGYNTNNRECCIRFEDLKSKCRNKEKASTTQEDETQTTPTPPQENIILIPLYGYGQVSTVSSAAPAQITVGYDTQSYGKGITTPSTNIVTSSSNTNASKTTSRPLTIGNKSTTMSLSTGQSRDQKLFEGNICSFVNTLDNAIIDGFELFLQIKPLEGDGALPLYINRIVGNVFTVPRNEKEVVDVPSVIRTDPILQVQTSQPISFAVSDTEIVKFVTLSAENQDGIKIKRGDKVFVNIEFEFTDNQGFQSALGNLKSTSRNKVNNNNTRGKTQASKRIQNRQNAGCGEPVCINQVQAACTVGTSGSITLKNVLQSSSTTTTTTNPTI